MFQQNLEGNTPLETKAESQAGSPGETYEKGPQVVEAPKEISIVQEQPTQGQQPAVAQTSNDDDTTAQPQAVANDDEIKEEFSGIVDKGADVWAKKAESVIDQYDKEPYREEEEAENLQIEYMSSRFGVKIDKKEHEIK